jgi:hypothetical protein
MKTLILLFTLGYMNPRVDTIPKSLWSISGDTGWLNSHDTLKLGMDTLWYYPKPDTPKVFMLYTDTLAKDISRLINNDYGYTVNIPHSFGVRYLDRNKKPVPKSWIIWLAITIKDEEK